MTLGRVVIAGHRGLVGSALMRYAFQHQIDVAGFSSQEVDLRDRQATRKIVQELRPEVLLCAAARVGGIFANMTKPVDFIRDNLLIQTNLIDAAHEFDVPRLVFLGSSCVYPRNAHEPITESQLLSGYLEPTNESYAVAKIAGISLVQSYRRQFNRAWVNVMPSNLYGPNDNFDLENSHVLPAFIRRFIEASQSGAESLALWGDGSPRREFLHVDDLASAIFLISEEYDHDEPINVGAGEDISIRDLASIVADSTNFRGEILWDPSKPNGVDGKLLDVSKIHNLGWKPHISLRSGIDDLVDWYRATNDI